MFPLFSRHSIEICCEKKHSRQELKLLDSVLVAQLHDSVLFYCMWIGIYPFILHFQFTGIQLFIVISYVFLFISGASLIMSIFYFIYLRCLFFLINLTKDLSILLLFSKNQITVFFLLFFYYLFHLFLK